MKKSDLREYTVTALRGIVRDENLQILGAWKMKKDELVEKIYIEVCESWEMENDEIPEIPEVIEESAKPQAVKRGRTRIIEVYKDGELIKTIDGLLETFKWAVESGTSNQGWVKHSLKTGKETVAGRKFKTGGYLFKYTK